MPLKRFGVTACLVVLALAACTSSAPNKDSQKPTNAQRQARQRSRLREAGARAEVDRRYELSKSVVQDCGLAMNVRDARSPAPLDLSDDQWQERCWRLIDVYCPETLAPADFDACAEDMRDGHYSGTTGVP